MTRILLIEAAVLALAVGFLIVHGVWVDLSRRRLAGRERVARAALTQFVVGGDRDAAARALRQLTRRSQIRLLVEIGRNLVGTDRAKVGELAADLGLLDHARRQTRSRAWHQRLRGARLLTLLDPDPDALIPLLDDPNDAVRSQAIEAAADRHTPEAIGKLIGMLADEKSLCRFAVRDSLLRIGPAVIEPLAAYLAKAQGAAALAALQVAGGMPDHRFVEATVDRAGDASAQTRAAAAELLGAVGGTAPLLVLETLLDDPAPAVRAAAAAGLGRLQHWRAAERLAGMLRDPDFEVRRAAATGLQSLGPAGELVLRGALSDPDPFAADMAQLALDVAAVREIA